MTMKEQIESLKDKIDMAEDEDIEFLIKRHWVALATYISIPFILLVASLSIFIYRSIGGTFIFMNGTFANTIDAANILLAFFAVVSVGLAIFFGSRKHKRLQQTFFVTTLLLGATVVFRYQGGRVFHIDPLVAQQQRFDIYNIILIGVFVLAAAFCVYVYYEWNNDFLILTNERVIYWHEILLGTHTQDQLYIEDIQNVIANRATYVQYWLNFGSIQITSAAFRPPMQFEQAAAPQDMQAQVMKKVNSLRQQESKQNFDAMIKIKVYGEAPPPAPPKTELKPAKTPPLMNLLFYENPYVDEKGNITWRQHWVFIPIVVVKPALTLIASFIAVFVLNQFVPLGGLVLTIILATLIVGFVLWTWYLVEDERNEQYILQPTVLIDIEKKPLGPEQRNTASLGSVQNVKFETSLLGRIIGYGNVVIETAGAGGTLTFPRLPNPEDVVSIINEYRIRFRKGEKERGLNDTLTLIRHYHNLELEREKEAATASTEPGAQPTG